jgi:hypothetical protein
MQKSNVFLSLFTKKRENTNISTPFTLTQTDIPLSKWYRSIEDLPLRNFIDAAVDGNLSALIISGTPTQLDLLAAWQDIQSEFADTMGDHEHRLYMILSNQVRELSITLEQITTLIECLLNVYYEPFAIRLNSLLHTNFKFDPTDQKAYDAMLRGCAMRSKDLKIDIELKLIEMQAIEQKHKSDGREQYTKKYFKSVLRTLSDHVKYRVEDTITTFEYCDRLKSYIAHCEDLNRQIKKGYGR